MKRFLPILILILAPLSLLVVKPVCAQVTGSPEVIQTAPAAFNDTYSAEPGDSLWMLAASRVEKSALYPGAGEYTRVMAVNAVKNLEIMLNNLDDTNYFLEVNQSYKLLTQTQVNDLTYQVSKYATVGVSAPSFQLGPENAGYLIANPSPIPNWQELRQTASYIPNLLGQTTPAAAAPAPQVDNLPSTPTGIPVRDVTIPISSPTVQGAHTSIVPLADSPFPY